MVARALRRLGVQEARVNERHDLVVGSNDTETYKISGSAYKLITGRALHHGTCLLGSPNLGEVGRLLRSPAEGYMHSKGVRSVRSPIRNVGVGNEEFVEEVVREFGEMYEGGEGVVVVDEEEAGEAEWMREEVKTIMSDEWRFGQTPQFTFSTRPTEEDPRERELPGGLPSDVGFRVSFFCAGVANRILAAPYPPRRPERSYRSRDSFDSQSARR
jgi:lipoate-protein ligase A